MLLLEKIDKWTRPVQVIDSTWKDFFIRNKKKKGLIVGCDNRDCSQYGITLDDVVFTDIAVSDITHVLTDVQHLPFKDEQSDWIFSAAVLEHVPNVFAGA